MIQPIPQLAGVNCKHTMVRMGCQLEVRGEKHGLGHLGLLQTHRDFPNIKVLDSCQHRLGRRKLRPCPQSAGQEGRRAWGMGPAVRCSLVSGRRSWLSPSPHPPPGPTSHLPEGSKKQGGVHQVSGPRGAQKGSPKIITMCTTLDLGDVLSPGSSESGVLSI